MKRFKLDKQEENLYLLWFLSPKKNKVWCLIFDNRKGQFWKFPKVEKDIASNGGYRRIGWGYLSVGFGWIN